MKSDVSIETSVSRGFNCKRRLACNMICTVASHGFHRNSSKSMVILLHRAYCYKGRHSHGASYFGLFSQQLTSDLTRNLGAELQAQENIVFVSNFIIVLNIYADVFYYFRRTCFRQGAYRKMSTMHQRAPSYSALPSKAPSLIRRILSCFWEPHQAGGLELRIIIIQPPLRLRT